jgi:hypothetical protein
MRATTPYIVQVRMSRTWQGQIYHPFSQLLISRITGHVSLAGLYESSTVQMLSFWCGVRLLYYWRCLSDSGLSRQNFA